ncbi:MULTISPECIES: alpha/beta hydrolase [unclassified Modicisalibacter]|uniref:alpha/beta fold hydrolase n=1 Tax=unclassified Modicisalibacter TaxID=2679913 RepID=UPI001CCC7F89|nr:MULTISPECIES: alpha/beta hydrolase [unclassified Modicisalibacter]MBZ9557998.1 alpha/beta hydrolase [Modicisalibacter sp. R2A 31.J]MBZ9573334.1 alpha/beta hydrolase [Modicisalibacter sp. MOD 31.J]
MSSSLCQLFPSFETRRIEVEPRTYINALIGGSGPPLLLLHGHPQTLAIWHKVAPALAEHFTVVAADLRGYGDSSKPVGLPDHSNYSKRVMAQDQLTLMRRLGFERFDLLAHDRGARVAHRLAIDHPQAVSRLILLDIAPTLSMYQQTSETFARTYWHWFLLIQPASLPERLIEVDPAAYIVDVMGRRSAGLEPFDPRALDEYRRCIALDGTAHGICEDYRAAAGIDMEHERDDIDAGRRITAPVLVMWGEHGVIQKCFRPLEEWKKLADKLEGGALPCGHYIAEEAPDALLARVLPFLLEADS